MTAELTNHEWLQKNNSLARKLKKIREQLEEYEIKACGFSRRRGAILRILRLELAYDEYGMLHSSYDIMYGTNKGNVSLYGKINDRIIEIDRRNRIRSIGQ